MPKAYQRDDFTNIIKSLTKRIADLERHARIPYSSIKEGNLQVWDEVDQTRIIHGKLADGNYGVRVLGPQGQLLTQFDASGWRAPYQPVVMIAASPTGVTVVLSEATYEDNDAVRGSIIGDVFVAGQFLSLGVSTSITPGDNISLSLGIEIFGTGEIQEIDDTIVTVSSAFYMESPVPNNTLGKWCRVSLRGRLNSAPASTSTYRLISPCSLRPL